MSCEHLYSRQIDQPYPRHCVKCGEIEGGDVSCHQEPETRPLPTRGSNAAPNVQPAGCGTIALHVMTLNGKDKLPALFRSVQGFCDKAVVLDTGSTNGTQKWLMEEQDLLPVELLESSFKDFGTSRTEGMRFAKGKSDWLLLLDDDMRLCITDPLIKDRLDPAAGCYMIKHEAPVAYWITRLVRGDQDWEYKGVTHEYLDRSHAAPKLEGLVVDHQYNHGPEKFERDLKLLSADIARDPYDARTIFYLAQTLRDMRHTLPAIRYYEMRARMGGWPEEVYYAMYEAARLAEDPDAMRKAFEFRSSRAEAPQWLAWYYKKDGDMKMSDSWENMRRAIPMTSDILFVNQAAYDKKN